MKRLILDTNIYGEMIFDVDYPLIKENIRRKVVVNGFRPIRNELRDVPRKVKVEGKNLRIRLLHIYDEFTSRCYDITPDIEELSKDYFKIYHQLGGGKGFLDMRNDFLIVACASINQVDVVVSEDNKTMLSEHALKAYQMTNSIKRFKTPEFIGYLKFKKWLI